MHVRHALVCALAVAVATTLPAVADQPELEQMTLEQASNTYIVYLADSPGQQLAERVDALATSVGASVKQEFAGVGAFSAQLTSAQAEQLRRDARIVGVEKSHATHVDAAVPALATEELSWGLDRIDQTKLPLSKSYAAPGKQGEGVHAYVIDTGLDTKHPEFAGRVGEGFNALSGDNLVTDPHGHGTHVAGTVAGATTGVAPKAIIHGVRVYRSMGGGTTENLVAGIDWVIKNKQTPAVANLSMTGGVDPALETALRRLVAADVTVAVAAGNEYKDACRYSPSRMPEVITVASSNMDDARSSFSNWGKCVTIFAPGLHIVSAKRGGGYEDNSGTSMASPHVTGAAALYLAERPTATPADIKQALIDNSSKDFVKDVRNSPNRILNVSFIGSLTQGSTS